MHVESVLGQVSGSDSAALLLPQTSDFVAALSDLPEMVYLESTDCASWSRSHARLERRSLHRVGFSSQVLLADPTQLDNSDPEALRAAEGRDLSAEGLSFSHRHPFPHRSAAVSLETPSGWSPWLLVELRWCRFTRQQTYQTGGRFVKVLADHCRPEVDGRSVYLA